MKDGEGKVLYVGKAKHLKSRIKQYFLSSNDTRPMIPFLRPQVVTIDTIVVPSEKEALLLENTLIKKHQPPYNAILKDDKTFISLMIDTTHPWPILRQIRYKGEPDPKKLYFGPYTSGKAAKKTYETLTRLFPLRQCSDEELKRRTQPCILYSIKRCLAPCVNKCTPEEYAPLVHNTIEFLKGNNTDIIQDLYKEMQQASQTLDFEKAASLLRTIRQLEHVAQSQSLMTHVSLGSCDALGCWSQGSELFIIQLLFRSGKLIGSNPYSFSGTLEEEKAALTSFLLQHYTETFPDEILLPFPLDEAPILTEILTERRGKPCLVIYPKKGEKQQMRELAQNNAKTLFYQNQTQEILREKTLSDLQITLKLERYPARIACFDTSHIAGSDPVASLVIFSDGINNNKEGRLFNIKNASPSDDYGSLREVLTRYLKRTESLPDLIIVDGGKGQLHAALAILHELSIASVDLIALTKEKGRHDKGMTEERVFLPSHADPIHLNPRSHLLFFLQTIRDEAHRKALSFHQKRRSKRHLTSELDALPGIGPVKKQRLLKHFGSVANLKRASLEELQQVPGLTAKDLLTLQKHLR